MQWMFPAIITLSAYLFLRGHDLPGGGFAAGVALAIGFLLQYLAANVRWVEDRLRILPVRWMGAGLLIAAATGAGALALRLSVPDRERALRRRCRSSATCRSPPRSSSTSASSRWSSAPPSSCSSRWRTSRCAAGRAPEAEAEAPAAAAEEG